MANIFNSVELQRPAFSRFNKSFKEKYTCNIGELYPIYFEEVVPGSNVRLNASHFVRFQPMLAPVFDSMHYRQYYFFVPYRLLCTLSQDKWEEFRTGGKEQLFSDLRDSNYIPQFNTDSLEDELTEFKSYYTKFFSAFQLPPLFVDMLISGLPHEYGCFPIFAYWKIITDYFCDEQLDSDLIEHFNEFISNDNDASFWNLLHALEQLPDNSWRAARFFRKRYKKDYFTSATLQPQLGTGISLPLNSGISFDAVNPNSLLEIFSNTFNISSSSTGNLDVIAHTDTPNNPLHLYINDQGQLTDAFLKSVIRDSGSLVLPIQTWDDFAKQFKLTNNGLFSVDDLRNSFLMQELLERNNVAGYRYFEWIYSHFGIVSPDARLQRSEFLGSTDDVINFVEVEQTNSASDSTDTPLGYLAGKGIGGGANAIFDRTFTEDGIIIGLACYVPENTYYQGIPKMYLRRNGLDMLTPLFERLGEQAISNEELVYNGDSRDSEVFGYTSRYADYKSSRNIAKGDFTDSLKFWTFARDLSGFGLSSDFLQINYEDFDDVFAVQSDAQGKPLVYDKIMCVQNFDVVHRLPLHRYSNPARI